MIEFYTDKLAGQICLIWRSSFMKEHGTYSVTLQNNVLNIRLVGMFNEIATRKVCEQIEQHIDMLNTKSFKLLVDCLDYEGSTRAAHKISNQHLLWLIQQNCQAQAAVYGRKLYADIVKNEQPAVGNILNRREFTNIEEAKNWLEQI